MDVRLPDGTIIRGVPDNITRAELIQRLERNGYDTSSLRQQEAPRASFPSGYMQPDEQRKAWESFEGSTLPGDRMNPVPGGQQPRATPVSMPAPVTPPAPMDAEAQRMQNTAEVFAATGRQGTRAEKLEQAASVQEQIDKLKAERDATYRYPLPRVEKAKRVRELSNQIAALEEKLPSDPYSTVGGIAGGVVGGVVGGAAGSVTGPGGLAVGGIGGSITGGLAGTLAGAAYYANKEGMSPEETNNYLRTKGIESVVFDTVGNVVFLGGGKIIGSVAKNTAIGKGIVKALGGKLETLKVDPADIRAGERVFGDTTEAELKAAAERGARTITSPNATPSAGQLTGEPSLLESAARSKDPGAFDAARRAQTGSLEAKVEATLANARKGGSEFSGTDLRNVLNDTERAVKDYFQPVWAELKAKRGPGQEIVDFSEISTMARKALDENAAAKVRTLDKGQLEWLRRLASGGQSISPGEAQDLLSTMLAIARDANNPTMPNSRMASFATDVASKVRTQLDAALAGDPKFAQAREIYKEMMDVLYDPALAAARRGGESAAGRKALKQGEVEGVQALERLQGLAQKIDALPGSTTALGAAADVAKRGAIADYIEKNAGTPEALANLHQKMGNPDFRKTLEAAVPKKEDRLLLESLSQAAQIAERARTGRGSIAGMEATAGLIGGQVGRPIGAAGAAGIVARLGAMMVPKTMAASMTQPKLRAMLPRVTAWYITAASQPLASRTVPGFVTEFMEAAKEAGLAIEE